MKKIIVPLICAVLVGLGLGLYLFSQYENKLETVFQGDEIIYILQIGVYSSEENAKKYSTKVDYYIIHHDDKYYRVYGAITHNKDLINRLKEYLIAKGNDIYVREIPINNLEFLELLKQYDLLLQSSSGDDELLQIEKQILSKYEELILRNE